MVGDVSMRFSDALGIGLSVLVLTASGAQGDGEPGMANWMRQTAH